MAHDRRRACSPLCMLAGKLDDTSCSVVQERALHVAGGLEPFLRRRMNDNDRMDRRLTSSAQFPFDRIALLCISEDSRSVRVRDSFLELGGKSAQHLGWQADSGETVGAEGDVRRHRRLDFPAVGRHGPRTGGRDRRRQAPQPPARLSRIIKLNEEVRSAGQVPVPAGDETLDVGQDVICEPSQSRHHRLTIAAAGRQQERMLYPNRRVRTSDR